MNDLITPTDLREISAQLEALAVQLEERHEAGSEMYYQNPKEWRQTPNGKAALKMLDALRSAAMSVRSAILTLTPRHY